LLNKGISCQNKLIAKEANISTPVVGSNQNQASKRKLSRPYESLKMKQKAQQQEKVYKHGRHYEKVYHLTDKLKYNKDVPLQFSNGSSIT
jgi:hypothetical protein